MVCRPLEFGVIISSRSFSAMVRPSLGAGSHALLHQSFALVGSLGNAGDVVLNLVQVLDVHPSAVRVVVVFAADLVLEGGVGDVDYEDGDGVLVAGLNELLRATIHLSGSHLLVGELLGVLTSDGRMEGVLEEDVVQLVLVKCRMSFKLPLNSKDSALPLFLNFLATAYLESLIAIVVVSCCGRSSCCCAQWWLRSSGLLRCFPMEGTPDGHSVKKHRYRVPNRSEKTILLRTENTGCVQHAAAAQGGKRFAHHQGLVRLNESYLNAVSWECAYQGSGSIGGTASTTFVLGKLRDVKSKSPGLAVSQHTCPLRDCLRRQEELFGCSYSRCAYCCTILQPPADRRQAVHAAEGQLPLVACRRGCIDAAAEKLGHHRLACRQRQRGRVP
eukprot:5022313-Pleurochrysis_carterae.AAC.2